MGRQGKGDLKERRERGGVQHGERRRRRRRSEIEIAYALRLRLVESCRIKRRQGQYRSNMSRGKPPTPPRCTPLTHSSPS